jgi:hypothetical protein
LWFAADLLLIYARAAPHLHPVRTCALRAPPQDPPASFAVCSWQTPRLHPIYAYFTRGSQDPSFLLDVCRQTVLFEDPAAIAACLAVIAADPLVRVVQVAPEQCLCRAFTRCKPGANQV